MDDKKRIGILEEELRRKDKEIQKLKEDNMLLLKTSLKQAEKNKLVMDKNLDLMRENKKLKVSKK